MQDQSRWLVAVATQQRGGPKAAARTQGKHAMYQTAYLTDVTDEAVLGDYWPGIQLYYPPVKYSPAAA